MAKAKKGTTEMTSAPALTLAGIVAATKSDAGFLFASIEAAKPFIDAGTAELNSGMSNPANGNEFAVRATANGIAAIDGGSEAPAAPKAPDAPKPTFEMLDIDADEVPNRKPGGGGKRTYPFDDLGEPYEVDGKRKYRSFFVPATAEVAKPWESLSSAVSAATRSFAKVVGTKEITKADGTKATRNEYEFTRKFKIKEHEVGGVKGALVSRIQ